MSFKHITLKINSAKETVETYPITSQQGRAVIVQAQPNVRYQLIDEATQFGPENIMAKRVGQDLQISFEGTQVEQPDLIIQDYYATNNNIGYSNGQANMLIGQHESGSFYPYVPESAQAGDAISMLAEQITAGQALGGEHLVTALWLPLSPIGANWLFWGSMLALGTGGLVAAVAGNNDSSPITPPSTIDNLVPTASNDSSAGHTLGQAVTINVLANDSDTDGTLVPGSVRLLDGNGQAQTSLTVPGEGVWSVNTTTGAITFTPNADFTGDPSPVNYQVADNLGATARASVSVDYNQPPTVEVTLTITPKQGEAAAGQPVATSAGTDPEGKPVTYSLDDPDGFYAIDPNTGVVTLSERGAAHINNGEDLPAVKVIVTDDAGLTGSDDSNITPPATAGNLQGVASFAAIDESHLGLNGEYYGYSDGLAYNADGSLKDGFFRHANDKYFGNLDGVSDMEGIINGRNAVDGAANNIVGTHTAAATNTPDARFKATKIDYGGVTNSLGHNPELASGSTTGMDENNSSLYKFLSLQGSTDAQSLVVEHGLGNTTDAGIRMTGYVYMEAGYYDFRVRSDDGFRLKIDGQTAVQFDGIRSDNWSDSVTSIDGGNTPHPDGFYVKGGLVAVELLYWEQGLNGQLNFQYQEHGSNTWKTLDLTNTLMINDSALPALNDLQDMVREADVWSIRTGEVLDSGAGNDVIVGSAGRDYIMGGKDNDTLSGGDGNDTFIYSLTQDNGTDTITDFTVGKDKIVFSDVLSAHDLNPNTPAWLSPDNAQWDDAAKTLSFSGSENGVSYTNNVHFSNMSDSYATVAEFLAANGVV